MLLSHLWFWAVWFHLFVLILVLYIVRAGWEPISYAWNDPLVMQSSPFQNPFLCFICTENWSVICTTSCEPPNVCATMDLNPCYTVYPAIYLPSFFKLASHLVKLIAQSVVQLHFSWKITHLVFGKIGEPPCNIYKFTVCRSLRSFSLSPSTPLEATGYNMSGPWMPHQFTQ